MRNNTYLLERARELFTSRRDLLQLLDDSVLAEYGLTPPEVRLFAACLIEKEAGLASAERLAAAQGCQASLLPYARQSLQTKGLLALDGDTISLPALSALRVESEEEAFVAPTLPPEPKLVFKPMRQRVVSMARAEKTPAAGLAQVYALLYGAGHPRRNAGQFFGVLGKIAQALGTDAAALLLLEYAHAQFEGDPLAELLPIAIGRGKGYRPENAPDEDAQQNERLFADRASWELRMRRWLHEYGGEPPAGTVAAGAPTPEQATADLRQIASDFARWRQAGSPAFR
jgi:hypothetical protein